MQIVQLNIFNEKEVIKPAQRSYNDFVKKFEAKKTTDDCYTPSAVYEAVKNFVNDYLLPLDGYEVLRPFKPNGDYLSEIYTEKTVVIDNPPFSRYSQIVKNYLRMNVKFFLFAPALSLFVVGSSAQYVLTASNITYDNGAKVRTSFCTNLLPNGVKLRFSPILKRAIIEAQNLRSKALKKIEMPKNYASSAQLLKYVCGDRDFVLKGSSDYLTKIGNRKIFGAAMRLTAEDVEVLTSRQN